MSLGITGKKWFVLRQVVLARDNHKCQLCGGVEKLHIHHIIPYKFGGKDTPSNLITLCIYCHMPAEFAKYTDSIKERLKQSEEWFYMRLWELGLLHIQNPYRDLKRKGAKALYLQNKIVGAEVRKA